MSTEDTAVVGFEMKTEALSFEPAVDSFPEDCSRDGRGGKGGRVGSMLSASS